MTNQQISPESTSSRAGNGSDRCFVGIDLAWKPANRTGMAVIDDTGRLRESGTVRSDDEVAAWLAENAPAPIVVAVDAPLIVPNETGQRMGENLIAKAYGRYGASPYPSNLGNPMFNPPRALTLTQRFSWTTDPAERGSQERPACIEVYPHPAMVGLFELGAVLPYKSGKSRTPDTRRAQFTILMDHLESIDTLMLRASPRWHELRRAVEESTRHMHLEAIEDELDAILCAHLAWLWHNQPDSLEVYGSREDGYIVAPPAPTHARLAVIAPETSSVPPTRPPNGGSGSLDLGHILDACQLDRSDVLVIRHTYTEGGLQRGQITPENVIAYVRTQKLRFAAKQPRLWLNFIADGGMRARFFFALENRGEVPEERTDVWRSFDLGPSSVMGALENRLVIEWSQARAWYRKGENGAQFHVVEIADPQDVAFPGFDQVLLTHEELKTVVDDARFHAWRTALGSVQGVYLIADTKTGKQYVGKADGSERILGRWTAYSRDGHGGNVALRELAGRDASHAASFVFSLLRVFGPDTPTHEVDRAEAHFKRALVTREFGFNRN